MAKEVSVHALLKIAQLLFEAADQIDDAAATMPTEIQAGPLADQVGELQSVLITQQVELVVRTRMAALAVVESAILYAAGQQVSAWRLEDVLQDLEEAGD
ncbi:hypothetical protein [Flindersiella endophytica]